jgi:hypothetical protein
MSSLLSLLIGWKGYAAAGLLSALLAAGGTYYVTSLGYRLTIAGLQRDQATAAAQQASATLTQFTSDAARIHDAAAGFAAQDSTLGQKFDTLSKDLHNAIQNHPLPADCAPDAGRLHQLDAAVAAANAAAGYGAGASLPPNP